ncbi:MAG: hypothetical protein H6628_12150 [Calditrichae bacterium]|nr:hypothetical protein [Calditrichia bacterium]
MNATIKALIAAPVPIPQAAVRLGKDLTALYPESDPALLTALDLREGYRQFQQWLMKLLRQDPVPKDIVALYFGLFEGNGRLEYYLTGAPVWSPDDPDWPGYEEFMPVFQHARLDILAQLYPIYQQHPGAGAYLALGMSVLFIINYISSNSHRLLPGKGLLPPGKVPLVLATGFEGETVYNLLKVRKKGFELIG